MGWIAASVLFFVLVGMSGIITWAISPPGCYLCTNQAYMFINYPADIPPFGRAASYAAQQKIGDKMTIHQQHHIPWYLWPFVAIWKLLAVIVEMTGRLVAMILGIVLMIAGVLISLTIVGAIIGIPLAIIGLLLFIKGIF